MERDGGGGTGRQEKLVELSDHGSAKATSHLLGMIQVKVSMQTRRTPSPNLSAQLWGWSDAMAGPQPEMQGRWETRWAQLAIHSVAAALVPWSGLCRGRGCSGVERAQ